jgi:uncharacterized protein YvpB
VLGWLALAAWLSLSGPGDAHVLNVPYRNQLDGSGYELANCGPTALSMALAYYGVDASPWDLRVQSMKAQHSWVTDEGGYSDGYGVFVYNLATVAEGFGLHADGLWARDGHRSDHYHQWQAYELRRELDAGHPVIVQVAYRVLPAHSASSTRSDHFIVLDGTIGADFVINDPMGLGNTGPDEAISEADLLDAMRSSSAPGAGFAVVQPR